MTEKESGKEGTEKIFRTHKKREKGDTLMRKGT